MGCINVNILAICNTVLILYSFAQCYHWGGLGEGYMESPLFLTTACESKLSLYKFQLKTKGHSVMSIIPQKKMQGFPGGAVVKNPPANAGDMGSSADPGRSHMSRSN